MENQPPEALTLKANQKIVDENSCPACGGSFALGDDVARCDGCGHYFHLKCWQDQGGCNQPDCQGETKFCNYCGQEIKASALKCRHCGEYLDEELRAQKVLSEPKGPLKLAGEALTYAIISIFCCGIILGPVAIVKGSKAVKIIDQEPGYEGRGKAMAAIIIGSIATLLHALGVIIRLSQIR